MLCAYACLRLPPLIALQEGKELGGGEWLINHRDTKNKEQHSANLREGAIGTAGSSSI